MKRWLVYILVGIFLTGCVLRRHKGNEMGYLSGVNLGYLWKLADINQLIRIKRLRIVRLPDNRSTRIIIEQAIHKLKDAGIMPLIVFDTANNLNELKKDITFYINRYGRDIYYEVLNEPIMMQGSPGYLDFTDAADVVRNMNKLIDYIHSKIGSGRVLNCGIADTFGEINKDLLKQVVAKGHQDILSIHVYTCNPASVDKYLPIIKQWTGPVWVTETGTRGDKEAFYNACLPMIYNKVHPAEVIWFDWNSKTYGLKYVPNYERLF